MLSFDHVAVSKAMVKCAFAFRDFNGGIDDTCHAAKCMHDLVDEAAALHDSEYTPKKMQQYLKKTGQA
jgi:hypothetical protein